MSPRGAGDPIQGDLFAGQGSAAGDDLDTVLLPPAKGVAKRRAADAPASRSELTSLLHEHGLRLYPRSTTAINLPPALKCERRPELLGMDEISRGVAARLEISPRLSADAIKVAKNRLREIERHTELTTRASRDEEVPIVTDRNALAREALQALRTLPQVEDADLLVILEVLAMRMVPALEAVFDALDEAQRPDESSRKKLARDCAHWIAKQRTDTLAEAIHAAIAEKAETLDAGPLPDAMLFPDALPLRSSRHNIYGCFPPSSDELAEVEQTLLLDDRAWLAEHRWALAGAGFLTGRYDASSVLNGEERAFAQALDRSPFVAWWHRNPDRKSYSVRLVRGEHRNFFHPDFVVCLEHFPGDRPLIRLIETKENVKDAARKARHVPSYYGKVLFLTKDQQRLRWVRDDGSLGSEVDLDDLGELREWLRASRPQVG